MDKKTFRRIPAPGLRIFKTGLAVMVCVIIAYFRRPYALPFYSSIAAILCMQKDSKAGRKAGLNRMIATLVGGVYGYLICRLSIVIGWQNDPFWHNFLAGLAVMPLIYITVLINQRQVSYIACVVSLSISLTHGQDPNPLIFAINRVVDTLIGVVVAVGINEIPFLSMRLPEETCGGQPVDSLESKTSADAASLLPPDRQKGTGVAGKTSPKAVRKQGRKIAEGRNQDGKTE